MGIGFFAAWLTTELAMLHIVWQVVGNRRLRRVRRARRRGRAGSGSRSPSSRGSGCSPSVASALGRPTACSPPRSTTRSATDWGDDARPDAGSREPTPFEWRRVAVPVPLQAPRRRAHHEHRVRRRRATPPAPARRLPARRRGPGRAGAAPDPRRRVGHRQQGPAGPAADVPPRGARLGVRRDQLPADARRRRGPTTSSTASARSRGCASTSPSTAATPTTSSSPAARPAGTSPR